MAKDLTRLMHALFLPAAHPCREGQWCPPADVYRTATGWIIKFDLAGVRIEDLSIEVHGNRLRLRGTRRDQSYEEGCYYYQMEIAYSQFERVLDLPCNLQRADIATEYRDGMLLVRIILEATGESQ